MVLEKTLESPLDCKEIQPVHPKGDQSQVFIGKTDADVETLLISVLICFGYAKTAAANELTAERMTRTVLLAHVPAVLVYAAQWAVFLIRRGKQNS